MDDYGDTTLYGIHQIMQSASNPCLRCNELDIVQLYCPRQLGVLMRKLPI